MKTNRFNSVLSSAILSSAIAMGLLVSTGRIQAQNSPQARATIPFAFQVGSRNMPAGLYSIYLLSEHSVLFRAANGHGAGYFLVNPFYAGKVQTKGRVVFHRYGDRYFLREVWEEGSNHGITCNVSPEENEILRAQDRQPVTQTEVALSTGPKR
jgi:hypothetical protein